MDLNRAELAAVNGVTADLLDAQGRLVITPHAVTLDGQRNVPADLRPGESLADFLGRHVPGIESGAWTAMISGARVPQHMWAKTYPKHGMLIACRASVGRQVVSIIAMAVLTYFSAGIASSIYGALGGTFVSATAATSLSLIQAGVVIAGATVINKVLAPKVPKMNAGGAANPVYSLSGQRNRMRPHEPLPTLWGEMRVTPDLASMPYNWFEADDQYLSTILLGGINVDSAADLSVGDTPLTNYTDVQAFHNGFSGMPSVDVPLYSNADTITGAELENDGDWIVRISSTDTTELQFDFEGQLYDIDGKGNTLVNSVPLFIETRPVGSGTWLPAVSTTLTNATTDVLRRTFSVPVVQGQHEARVRLGAPTWDDGDGKDQCKIGWNVLRSIQPDTTDYSAWGRIGIKFKATGQLSGSLDTLRVTYRARPIPLWNGTEWVTASTREEGLSNPGAILLQTARGVYANGILQFGYGMQDEQIDIEGLKAFMLHCTAHGYTYDKWITSDMSLGQFCQEVALAGMGEFSWTDGSRPTAVFVSDGQPLSGVVNMANMLKASFEVSYNLSNAADGIEYQFLDRERNWETTTLRVTAPGVTTMLNPARITGEGVTNEAHAAVMARYHLAQSLYQYKTIGYTADIEHLDYRRLSVLSVSHDLTQWGFGGRLVSAQIVGGRVQLDVGEDLPALPTPHVGLRLPGERDYRVWPVDALAVPGRILTLQGTWPAGIPLPGATSSDPAHDTLWCYDFKATPGYRVRVVSMEPEPDLKGAKVSCVPEGPEFWNYVLNGTYEPAGNQSSLPHTARPSISDVRITEQVNIQGDTEWYELMLTWEVGGDYDHAQVWAARDGSQPALVDGMALGRRSRFRIDGEGQYLIRLVPFSPAGVAGDPVTEVYATVNVAIAMRNVDHFTVHEMPGGLRRYTWAYDGDRPAKFSGVQIRYAAGDVPATAANWDAMTPVGEAGDIYTAHFESTLPTAGLYTFGCRAIDTAGTLSNGVLRTVVNLGEDYDEIHQVDLTPPPDVTGLKATAVFSSVMVEWDAATYSVGRGHARTIVYAAQGLGAAFAGAVQVAEAYSGPVSFASEPATAWTIWAKHETNDGVRSFGEGSPVSVTTAADVEKVLEALTGQITEGQLYNTLGQRIGLIDGIGPGSVNARIAPLQGSVDTINAQLAEITGAPDHNPALTYVAGKVVKSGGKLYRAKINVPASTAITNTTYWELIGEYAGLADAVAAHAVQLSDHESRIGATEGGLVAEATARDTLATQMRGGYTGTDANAVTQGLVFSERQARSSAVATEASARQTLAANITSASSDNLVSNPTYDPSGWLDTATGNYTVSYFNRSATPSLAGAPAARVLQLMKNVGTAEHAGRRIFLGSQPTAYVPANTGDVFDVSFSAGSPAPTAAPAGSTYVWLYGTDLVGNAVGNAVEVAYDHSVGGWQKLRGTITVSGGAALVTAQLVFGPGASSGHHIWICDLDIRKRSASAMALSVAVQTEASVRASADGYLGAQQNVRIDVAGHVAGYGLAGSTPDGSAASATSAFGVRASSFFVAPPAVAQATAPTANLYDGFAWLDTGVTPNVTRYRSGSSWTTTAPVLPFVIQTTPTTINGVTVPAGVYMDAAFMRRFVAVKGQIGSLAVDDANIANLSVSKILAGSMVVGQYINSANYVPGSQGWSINAAGSAEFSGVVVRGTVYATAGSIGGILVGSGAVQSANYAWDTNGFYLGADGAAVFNNVRTRGAIMGGAYTGYAWPASGTGFYLGPQGLLLGTFSSGRWIEIQSNGDVRAPQFSIVNGAAIFGGTLDASAVNAVNTINIAGQAVTTLTPVSTPSTVYDPNDWRVMLNYYGTMSTPVTAGSGCNIIAFVTGAAGGGGDVDVEFRVRNVTAGTTLQTWSAAATASTGGAPTGHYYSTNATVIDGSPVAGTNHYVLESRRQLTFWTAVSRGGIFVARR